jgi:hypothetical protein
MLERQLIQLNEDLQTLEYDKNELNEQIDELKEQLQSKDRQIQTFQVSKHDLTLSSFKYHLDFHGNTWFSISTIILTRYSRSFSISSNL